jgi:hypothetical protein
MGAGGVNTPAVVPMTACLLRIAIGVGIAGSESYD